MRRLAKAVVERAAGPGAEDRALRWRGTAQDGMPLVRVAHFGDCGWREMARSHGVHTDPGYPKAMAEVLAESGVGMEFSSWVVSEIEWLPAAEYLDVYLRLTGEPDIVLIQLGSIHSRLAIFPDTPELLRLRERLGRKLGRHIFAAQRVHQPFRVAFGRFRHPYPGIERYATFVADVRDRWPQARVVVLLPWQRTVTCKRQRAMAERVRADERAAAEAAGVEVLDLAEDALPDRCANGYNLGPESSRRVGRRLARELVRPPARA